MDFPLLKILILTPLVLLSACAQNTIRIESEPAGAEVSLNERSLGKTPLDLSEANLPEIKENLFLKLQLKLSGYQPVTTLINSQGDREVRLKLAANQESFFDKEVLADFQEPVNQLVRESLIIQGLLVAEKISQAEERLNKFVQKYPNIAAGYVMQANLEMAKNKKDNALRLLERARSIDPGDTVVVRLIENLRKKSPP